MVTDEHKKTLAFFTVLDDSESSANEYSVSLISHLKKFFDITVYTITPTALNIDLEYIPIKNYTDFKGKEQIIIYNIDNDEKYGFMYPFMQKYPGISILHDLNVFYFFYRNSGLFKKISLYSNLARNHGIKALIHGIGVNTRIFIGREETFLPQLPEEHTLLYGWYGSERTPRGNYRWTKKKFGFQIADHEIKTVKIKLYTDYPTVLMVSTGEVCYVIKLRAATIQEITIPVAKKEIVQLLVRVKKPLSTLTKIRNKDPRELGVQIWDITYHNEKEYCEFNFLEMETEECIERSYPVNVYELAHIYPMTQKIIRKSKAIIVQTEFMKTAIRRYNMQCPITVIPPGSAHPVITRSQDAIRKSLGLAKNAFIICSVGRVQKNRRIESILKAFKVFIKDNPESRYIICGSLDSEYDIQHIVVSMGLEKNVMIVGFVAASEMTEYIYASNLCFNLRHPTNGGISTILMRMLALGKPCAVSDVDAYKELPDNTVFKIKPDHQEIKQIVQLLTDVKNNSKKIKNISVNAKIYAQHTDWEQTAEKIYTFAGELKK